MSLTIENWKDPPSPPGENILYLSSNVTALWRQELGHFLLKAVNLILIWGWKSCSESILFIGYITSLPQYKSWSDSKIWRENVFFTYKGKNKPLPCSIIFPAWITFWGLVNIRWSWMWLNEIIKFLKFLIFSKVWVLWIVKWITVFP